MFSILFTFALAVFCLINAIGGDARFWPGAIVCGISGVWCFTIELRRRW